jgi:hypothetical protein
MRVLRTVSFLTFAIVFMGRAQEPPVSPPTQEMPKLPGVNPIPRPRVPPRLTAEWCSKGTGNCPHGYHWDCGPQAAACVPNCPKGYRSASSKSSNQDVCTTGKNPCVTISPVWPIMRNSRDWGWQAFLCDPKPVVVSKIDPIYPERAVEEKRQGTVEIWARGHEDATVQTTSVVGTYGDFQEAATTALKQWRWRSFLLHDRPIEFQMRIRYAFELTAGGPHVRMLAEPADAPKPH